MANVVDREFVRLTVPHHEQGVQMGLLAAEQAKMPQLKEMAGSMVEDQRKEIAQLEALFPSVGLSSADVAPDAQQAEAMQELHEHLASLSGHHFDQTFLALMTNHHLGAIQMSEIVLAAGEDAELRQLAGSSHDKQEKEAREMAEMLSKMSGGQGMMQKVKDAVS